LQAFYSVRSETQLMEQLQYNLLFRWFVGLSLDDEIWDEPVFTKNRERLIKGDIAKKFTVAGFVRKAAPDRPEATVSTLGRAFAVHLLQMQERTI
jgi:transposase